MAFLLAAVAGFLGVTADTALLAGASIAGGGIVSSTIFLTSRDENAQRSDSNSTDVILALKDGNLTHADFKLLESMRVAHAAEGQSSLTTQGASAHINSTVDETSKHGLRFGHMSVVMYKEHSEPVMGHAGYVVIEPSLDRSSLSGNETLSAFGTAHKWFSSADGDGTVGGVTDWLDTLPDEKVKGEAGTMVDSLALKMLEA